MTAVIHTDFRVPGRQSEGGEILETVSGQLSVFRWPRDIFAKISFHPRTTLGIFVRGKSRCAPFVCHTPASSPSTKSNVLKMEDRLLKGKEREQRQETRNSHRKRGRKRKRPQTTAKPTATNFRKHTRNIVQNELTIS